ncbi:N-acetylmannosamine-6-phosphate 2-epimerase [Paenibacillus lutimineralis]|uniref:Putative N-acetylmannosamine-6-phosphate 2-epimerase n=1 Tax=Paenibacillus lutimineralis TaxID=2707005 RepID=A0A3Q9IFQ1_9BACL|nr:N-acetylmannosamine-6-phosphate 2-epimerase [Paenibacillus lutimineralis]AZS17092.1 N-acetylmannosamine-6-phosphate 2-epimerase [Paenibacillus lutimineralis]
MLHSIIQSLKGGLIVSCQALEGEPFYGSDYMARFAIAAEMGNAVGIRANTPQDIRAIKKVSHLPLIGLWKQEYSGFDVYITPTLQEIEGVIAAGADIVAMDATLRTRPGGVNLADIVNKIREKHQVLLMADVSTVVEGEEAEKLGFDLISTTLSGYTDYSPQSEEPDIQLVAELSRKVSIPVLAEGKIYTPEQASQCIQAGAYAVVIGGAITRPQLITKKFTEALR